MTDPQTFRQSGERLLKLRRKLAARDGVPGYEKNCEELRAGISRLEAATLRPGNSTTSPDSHEASAVASEPPQDQSGERSEPVKSGESGEQAKVTQ